MARVWVAATSDGELFSEYRCLLDGNVIDGAEIGLEGPDFMKYPLCWNSLDGGNVAEGNHTLQVNFRSRAGGNMWVDVIEYRPSSEANVANEWSRVDALEEQIVYSSGWEEFRSHDPFNEPDIKFTSLNGASLTYNFTGKLSVS